MSAREQSESEISGKKINPIWENEFLCCEVSGSLQCLVCHKVLRQVKKYNCQRHYLVHHEKEYGSLQGVQRKLKIQELKCELSKLQIQELKCELSRCQQEQKVQVSDSAENGYSGGFTQELGVTCTASSNDQQQYCLKWNFHQNNQQTMLSKLLQKESFCDVTIACEDRLLRAHKLVLSACSFYFERILSLYEDQNPIIILKDVKFDDMSALLLFMYKGEIHIDQSQLSSLLETADLLKVRGLSNICSEALHLNDPVQTSEQINTNTIFVHPRTVQQMRRKISIPKSQHPHLHETPDLLDKEALPNSCEEIRSMDDPVHSSSVIKTEELSDESPIPEPVRTVCQKRRISVPERNSQRPMKIACRSMDAGVTQKEHTSVIPSASSGSSTNSMGSAAAIEGVLPMAEFLTDHGNCEEFWKKPWVVKSLKAVSVGEMTLLNCSDLLGVGYDILYSRYKEVYGVLKEVSVASCKQVSSDGQSDQERIVVRQDLLSPTTKSTTAAFPEVNQTDEQGSARENIFEPIINVKVESCSSLTDDETMENNTKLHSDEHMN